MELEQILLILIAILQVTDSQGITLRILRFLVGLIGGDTNGQQIKKG